MRVASRLEQIEKRMRVEGESPLHKSPVIFDPDNPDFFIVNGVEMTKAELDKLREEDHKDGMVILVPREED